MRAVSEPGSQAASEGSPFQLPPIALKLRTARLRSTFEALTISSIISVLAWPIGIRGAEIGVDASWIAGLHLAARDHLPFGTGVVFTYGPLGFLGFPQPYFGATSAIAGVVLAAIIVLTLAMMFANLRPAFGPWLAAVLVYLTVRAFEWLGATPWDLTVTASVLAGLWLLRLQAEDGRRRAAPLIVLCALAGVSLLAKVNDGLLNIAVATMVSIALARRSMWRTDLAVAMGAIGAGLVGAWLVAGQSPADLWPYLVASASVVAGYSAAMALDQGPTAAWLLPLYLLAAGSVLWLGFRSSSGWPRRSRLAVILVLLVVLFGTFKEAFVRMDHFTLGFAMLVTLVAALPVRADRAVWGAGYVGVLCAFIAVCQVFPWPIVDPGPRFAIVRAQVGILRSPDVRIVLPGVTAAAMREKYGIADRAIALLRGQTVHIEPWEAGVAFAYPEITWRPIPVFQAFQAYTPALDQLGASFLASDRAPERILRLPAGRLDARNPWFDAPATKIEMICRYAPLAASSNWQVLGRVPDRCGEAELIETVVANVGQVIDVPNDPRPDRMIVARISLPAASPLQLLRDVALRSPVWHIQLDDQNYRFIVGSAPGPLLLSAPATLGYAPEFASATAIRTLQLTSNDPSDVGAMTIRFESIAIVGLDASAAAPQGTDGTNGRGP